jgi:formiminotetrahydrofolate cyclodeaminase
MKVSMDGMRINLVRSFNKFCTKKVMEKLDTDELEKLDELRQNINNLLCLFDNNDDNCTLLYDEYKIPEIINEEDVV